MRTLGRRLWLIHCLRQGFALTLLLTLLSVTGAVAQSLVRVHEGHLRGETRNGVTSFKGVPFAAPPVGDLRWRPPQAAKPWTGVRSATSFPSSCEQEVGPPQLPWTAEFMPRGPVSEDCLYLNVWTPTLKLQPVKPLPVYVFIHGGAFVQGGTSVAVYDGAALATKGIVVVTIQYRLGIFGFLAHPALSAESPEHASGNYGLLDCLAALRWVKGNIAVFGGDPSRITVGGQSAGASAVHDLLASPLARGLIEGAIAESGSGLGAPMRPLALAEREGQAFVAEHGALTLAALRAMPADQLLRAVSGPTAFRFAPVVDGCSLLEDPNMAIAAGRGLRVPVLTGMQADEGSSSSSYGHSTAAQLKQQSWAAYGANEPRFEALYPFSDDITAGTVSQTAARDLGLASMYLWAALETMHEHSPVYTYYWAYALPWPEHPEFAAFHSSELPYVFGNLKVLVRPFTADDRALSAKAMCWWANFIRSGDPNGTDLPAWRSLQTALPETMQIGTDPRMRPLMSTERLAFWRTVLASGSAIAQKAIDPSTRDYFGSSATPLGLRAIHPAKP